MRLAFSFRGGASSSSKGRTDRGEESNNKESSCLLLSPVQKQSYDLPSIQYLSEQRRFDEITEILQFQNNLGIWLGLVDESQLLQADDVTCSTEPSSAAYCGDNDSSSSSTTPYSTSTVLHLVMQSRPPLSVVELLLQKLTELKSGYVPEAVVDESGQTPLHIAVTVGCDVTVIQVLTQQSEHPALTTDARGRFPLHYACCSRTGSSSIPTSNKRSFFFHRNHRNSKQQQQQQQQNQNQLETIEHLLDIYPQAVMVQDNQKQTPLDLAQEHNVDEHILECLTTAYDMVWGDKCKDDRMYEAKNNKDVPMFEIDPIVCDDDLSSVAFGGEWYKHRTMSRFAL